MYASALLIVDREEKDPKKYQKYIALLGCQDIDRTQLDVERRSCLK